MCQVFQNKFGKNGLSDEFQKISFIYITVMRKCLELVEKKHVASKDLISRYIHFVSKFLYLIINCDKSYIQDLSCIQLFCIFITIPVLVVFRFVKK